MRSTSKKPNNRQWRDEEVKGQQLEAGRVRTEQQSTRAPEHQGETAVVQRAASSVMRSADRREPSGGERASFGAAAGASVGGRPG